MKAVFRLLWTYFTGITLLRWITIMGLAGIAIGLSQWYFYPLLTVGDMSGLSPLHASMLFMLPTIGVLGLVFGGALMPLLAGRLAVSRLIYVLPYGRLKVLTSVFLTVALVAMLAGLVVMFELRILAANHLLIFARASVVLFFTYSLIYAVMLFVSRRRTSLGILGGALLIVAALALPMSYIARPDAPIRVPILIGGICWGLAAAAFLCVPRLRHTLCASGESIAARTTRLFGGSSYAGRHELEFMIGTARPWILASAQLFPIAVATWFIVYPTLWLFFLTVFSVMTGAMASYAASRARALWLRSRWTRRELFGRVEVSFLRHNAYAIGVLLVLFLGIATYRDYPLVTIVAGVPLLILGGASSSYLGLMMTRGIGVFESLLAITTMLLLMATAMQAVDPAAPVSLLVTLEGVIAAFALAFRFMARHRWTGIDWLQCRRNIGDPVHN